MKNAFLYLPQPAHSIRALLLLLFLMAQTSCLPPLIDLYDAETFRQTAQLKARCIVLMQHGSEPFSEYSRDVDAVMAAARSLYDQQKVRRYNKLTFMQWRLLMDDDAMPNTRAILPPFFERWKQEVKMNPVYIQEKIKNVTQAFDEILKLESAKIRSEGT